MLDSLFNPKKSNLQVYAEKISKANPNYEKDKHLRRYRRYYFDFDKENFEKLPTGTKIVSLDKKGYLEYFFNWNDVPGKDSRRLLKHLSDDLEINWVKENVGIKKVDNRKTIVVTNGDNSLSFKLDDRKKKLTLETIDGKTHEYIVKKENKRLNIYSNIRSYEWLNEIFEKSLFSLDLGYKQYLKNSDIDEKLKNKFKDNHIFLSNSARISKINEKTWEINDAKQIYTIEENDKKLKIEKYKSLPIKNILLKQIKITPEKKEYDFSEDTSLFGLLILCNYTDSKFLDGDIQLLNYLLGGEQIYPHNESQHLNLLSFIHKTRQSFYGMSSELALKESALRSISEIVEMSDIKEIINFLEKNVENYLSLIFKRIPPADNDKNKQSKEIKIKVFFTTENEIQGTTSAFPNEIIEYFHSEDFSKKIKTSFYEIFHSTEDPEGNEILKKINCYSDEEWKTLTVVKITKSRRIKHLCILRNEYFDISHYDRLIIKFLAEHIGVALFDFSLLEASLKTSKKTREYLKETTKLGVSDPSKPVEKYFEELLKIAIEHTGSECGNIYTLSKSKDFLKLRWQEGKGKKWEELTLKGVGVVPYVARNYTTYKDEPYVINEIDKKHLTQENKDPQIVTYIPALEGMESEMTLPMCFGKGLWGILNLESSKTNNYDEEKKQILLNIGQRASEIWQQRQLHYALEKTGDFLAEITVHPMISDEPDIYEAASKQIGELLDIAIESTSAHSITARFFDAAGEKLIRYAQSEKGKPSKVKKINCKKEKDCITCSAVKSGYLFPINSKFKNDLENNNISDVFRKIFEDNKCKLASNPKVLTIRINSEWKISDDRKEYIIKEFKDRLNIYKSGEIIDITDVKSIDKNEYPNIKYFKTKEGTNSEYAIPLTIINRIDGVLNVEGVYAFEDKEKFIFRTIARLIEPLLIHKTYLTRRSVFDHTTEVASARHRLRSFINRNKQLIDEFDKNHIGEETFVSQLKRAIEEIEEANIPKISVSEVGVEKIVITPNLIKEEVLKFVRKMEYGVRQKEPDIKTSKGLDEICFEANINQFDFILKDIIENAYKYGGPNTKISITIRKENNSNSSNNLELLITNSITKPKHIMKENIKSRIFRLPIDKIDRLSFGCFIDGIIISDMGGRVYVKQSNKSRGTTIYIKIPCENMGVE